MSGREGGFNDAVLACKFHYLLDLFSLCISRHLRVDWRLVLKSLSLPVV